jgi:transposase
VLAYIGASKFADYLPLYRLEEIFAGQGFAISRATQSVWCGDVADLVEPLFRRMAERVRRRHGIGQPRKSEWVCQIVVQNLHFSAR